MYDEALDNTAAAEAIKLESPVSKVGGKGRPIATAEEEGLFHANRGTLATPSREVHPREARKSLPILNRKITVEILLARWAACG